MMPGESIPQSETHTEPAEEVVPYPKDDYTIEIDGRELTPVLEPKIGGGTVVGYELLLRYRDTRQTYGPTIEIAEQNGTVGEVVRKTLASAHTALEALCTFDREAEEAPNEQPILTPIAVNVPLQELFGATFDFLQTLANDTPELVPYLELEITEREEYREEHVTQLSTLAKLGYHIVLDDFDTQYCNEETLKLFMQQVRKEKEQGGESQAPVVGKDASGSTDTVANAERTLRQTTAVHTIKLDKHPRTKDPVALHSMLHSLMDEYGVHVVVEGVEDADALERVATLGLPHEHHSTQGYVHGREPMTLSEYVTLNKRAVSNKSRANNAGGVLH